MAAILLAFLAVFILGSIEVAGQKSEQYCADVYSRTFSLANPASLIEEFPYMAVIGYGQGENTTWRCTGILISENYVMTTGHCLDPTIGPATQIKLGITNLNNANDEEVIQTINVSDLIKNPDFDPKFKLYNDVGLINLQKPVNFTKYVKPVCLETINKSFYPSMVTASLGILGNRVKQIKSRNDLKKFYVEEFNNTKCNELYPKALVKKGILKDSMICAHNRREDPCVESGNPLIIVDPVYGYRIVGVAAFGKKCRAGNFPTVFFRVSHYVKWIESVVWP